MLPLIDSAASVAASSSIANRPHHQIHTGHILQVGIGHFSCTKHLFMSTMD